MKTGLLTLLILIFAFFGIADAAYLTESAYSGTPLTCNIAGLDGCNTVEQSPYSHPFGVPIALYGMIFYPLLFILSAIALYLPSRKLYLALLSIATLGFLASIVFVCIQLFLINAICVYCFASAVDATVIFMLAFSAWKKIRQAPTPVVTPWDIPPVIS